MTEFTCTSHTEAGTVVVQARGEIDLAIADVLWNEISARLTSGAQVVLDCSGITFCDSAGLQVMLRAHREAPDRGAAFALAAIDGTIAHLLDLAGLTGMIPVQQAPPRLRGHADLAAARDRKR